MAGQHKQQARFQGRFQPLADEPLAAVALSVRVPQDVDALVRSLPDRATWLRQVIVEAAYRELGESVSESRLP